MMSDKHYCFNVKVQHVKVPRLSARSFLVGAARTPATCSLDPRLGRRPECWFRRERTLAANFMCLTNFLMYWQPRELLHIRLRKILPLKIFTVGVYTLPLWLSGPAVACPSWPRQQQRKTVLNLFFDLTVRCHCIIIMNNIKLVEGQF